MVAFHVDLDLLAESVGELTRGGEALESVLVDVARRVDELHLTWQGDAAVAQRAAQQQWAAGAREMREGLAAMQRAAAEAHAAYEAAVEANLRMWGQVG